MRNDSDPLQKEIDRFAIEYPAVLTRIVDYFSKRGLSLRSILELSSITEIIDLVDDENVDAYMIQLAGLLRYWVNN